MPIQLATGNHDHAMSLVEKALRRHSGATPAAARAVGGIGGHVKVVLPHPVFDLGLDQVLGEKTLDDASRRGWRYLVMQGPTAIAAAEVAPDASGGETVSAVNRGAFVAATLIELRRAEQLQSVQHGSFELRLLRIPALYIVALWLKDTPGDGDLLIPLEPVPNYLQRGQKYPAQQFLELAQRAAAVQANFDSRPVSRG